MRLEELKTPCALVDLERLRRNAAWARDRAARLGVSLRPHTKTHRCPQIARIQLQGLPGRVTVSTVAEALAMAEAGFTDITWAMPVPLPRLEVAVALSRSVERFSLLLDHPAAADAVEAAGRREGLRIPVFLKVDCGFGRAGVDPTLHESVELARRLAASPSLEFRGLLTHGGQAYGVRDREGALVVARKERDAVVEFARHLRIQGVEVAVTSVGSTPTFAAAEDLAGVTEVRPGNYIFFDAFQAAIGSCAPEDCAFSVLSTVVGDYPHRGACLLDAGALALSKDPGPVHVDAGCGFGRIVPCGGDAGHSGLRLVSLTQEHGLLRTEGDGARRLRIGERVRIVPNHSCLSAACFDRYQVVEKGEVVDVWRSARGW